VVIYNDQIEMCFKGDLIEALLTLARRLFGGLCAPRLQAPPQLIYGRGFYKKGEGGMGNCPGCGSAFYSMSSRGVFGAVPDALQLFFQRAVILPS